MLTSRARVAILGLTTAFAVGLAPVALADPECGPWGCAEEQPVLSVAVPVPAPDRPYTDGDWDRDGVVNVADNCPIVPNADQAPAIRPAEAVDDPLAVEWEQQHPDSTFRLNAELGEACSGWNGNWHRTEEALMMAPEPIRQEIWRFLDDGPMFGPDNLMFGGPICTTINDGWVHMIEYAARLPEMDLPFFTDEQLDCSTGTIARPFTEFVTRHMWGGKRLFTPTNAGGTISNRFAPSFSEAPGADQFAQALNQAPILSNLNLFSHGHSQTVNGRVIRGNSYTDGRPSIILDWRQVSGAGVGHIPIANLNLLPLGGILVYDECRALQEGIWPCQANTDIVRSETDRRIFQFGWMMFQDIDPSIDAWYAWEAANPEWTTPSAYGFDG